MTAVQDKPVTRRHPGLGLLIGELAIVALFVALVIVPYFVNGLQHEPATQVEGGAFDPKGLWPQHLPVVGTPLTYVAALVSVLGWLVVGMLSVVAGVSSVRAATVAARLRLAACVLLAVAFIAFQFSDFGRHVLRWMAD